jgi:3-methyl-2-oxobutanoate hydroxymethyltransferase
MLVRLIGFARTMLQMPAALTKKVSLTDLRAARRDGTKIPMLTCYDYTNARLMHQAGVPALLVGDSAANVVLGHSTTIPVPLSFMIELTAAVRRGAPMSFLVGDMPFGSYAGSIDRGVRNVTRMLQLSGCDCVKLEVSESHQPLVKALVDAGVAVMAHIGLRPQSVGLLGGYRAQGRNADDARSIVDLAVQMQRCGVAAILLEAVPPEVGEAVVNATDLPVIGCGAGPHCHGHVIVTHDALGLTTSPPRFVPKLADLATPTVAAYAEYVRQVNDAIYPGPEHEYEMDGEQRVRFLRSTPVHTSEPV